MKLCLLQVIENEQYPEDSPEFEAMDFVQLSQLKRELSLRELQPKDGRQRAEDFIGGVFLNMLAALPHTEQPSPFTVPLIYVFPNAKTWISRLYLTLCQHEYLEHDLFKTLRKRMYVNLCHVSGTTPYRDGKRPLKHAHESDLPLAEVNDAYLAGTPFHDLFAAPVPLKLTHEDRFNHWHILGGTGAGKTTLIENLILHDLEGEEQPSIILVEPHGDLTGKLIRADLGLGDRLIHIDPRDTQYPVALNPFAVNRSRLATYDEATCEQVTAGVIQTLSYLWNGLTNLALTGKQDVFAKYVIRLLLTMPEVRGENATILDMMKLMASPADYQDVVEALPDIPREFFKSDFSLKTFDGTKEQIRYRIQAIIENPTMARLFTATETKVDLFSEMNRGAVILVDTAKDFLKESSAVFGKLIISLVLQAVMERAAIPEEKRRPTFITIDEAGSFFSSNIDDLLSEARKYKAGLILAHQYLEQASGSLRASLAANTGIKFASGLSASDARQLAPEMRTSADFILGQPKYHFAAHIRHVTPTAVTIPIGRPQALTRLTAAQFEEQQRLNRRRVSLGIRTAPPRRPSTEPPQDDGEW